MLFSCGILVLLFISSTTAFYSGMIRNSQKCETHDPKMLFDFFKPKKSASASHILVKGKEGPEFMKNLKTNIMKSKNIQNDFSEAAKKYR
jgi:hypothetical protein